MDPVIFWSGVGAALLGAVVGAVIGGLFGVGTGLWMQRREFREHDKAAGRTVADEITSNLVALAAFKQSPELGQYAGGVSERRWVESRANLSRLLSPGELMVVASAYEVIRRLEGELSVPADVRRVGPTEIERAMQTMATAGGIIEGHAYSEKELELRRRVGTQLLLAQSESLAASVSDLADRAQNLVHKAETFRTDAEARGRAIDAAFSKPTSAESVNGDNGPSTGG